MKIAVLVSGGVDSSLALQLLHEQGHDVTAFYLKIWLEEELSFLGSCPWEDDLSYVKKLCDKLNVPLEVVSLQKEYWDRVVSYTVDEVKAGRTPNPDMLCNQRVKFGAFFDKIDDSCRKGCAFRKGGTFRKGGAFEKVATGHYAQIEQHSGVFSLKRTPDPIKDQTYFLAHLNQKQLSRVLFPVGNLTKQQVRQLAEKYDLPSKDRKDSQGICFLGKIKYDEFIRHHVGVKFGDIVEFETGEKLGTHEGFWYHTIGQRRGLGLSGGPWYVIDKDMPKNIVFVSNKYYSTDKSPLRNRFNVADCSWILGKKPEKTKVEVKVRHGQSLYLSKIELDEAG
ncbi:tRNA 2-thiouridine(34) synthase MnmA, partial [Candidatus Babeliales bacterium]|nr:tRNA 2-thiouridine(34) synthase MnmA [Candidatus Babeliales bacterium]